MKPNEYEDIEQAIDKSKAEADALKTKVEELQAYYDGQAYLGYSTHATSPQDLNLPSELTRDDFRRVEVKGMGKRYYFSHTSHRFNIEAALEPCANGFDVALYSTRDGSHPELIGDKTCTNLTEGIYKEEKREGGKEQINKLFMKELQRGTLERSSFVWDKALMIANEKFRSRVNEETLKRWKLLPKKKWEGERQIDPNKIWDDEDVQRALEKMPKLEPQGPLYGGGYYSNRVDPKGPLLSNSDLK